MGERLDFTAVIPTKDRPDHAIATVRRMLSQSRRPERIVVVDASTPPWRGDPQLEAEARAVDVDLVVLHERPSTAGQRNRGLGRVETPVVLFLDDDIEFDRDYSATLLNRWQFEGLQALGGIVGSQVHAHERRLSRLARLALMLHVSDPTGQATRVRASGKLRYVYRPPKEARINATSAAAVMYRTDLARKHLFDERFPGYALGEDLDMSQRLTKDGWILQLPDPLYVHVGDVVEGGRTSSGRWYYRGRRETYFRMKHLPRDPIHLAAFAVSIVGETIAATVDTVRERDARHVRNYLVGFGKTLLEHCRRPTRIPNT